MSLRITPNYEPYAAVLDGLKASLAKASPVRTSNAQFRALLAAGQLAGLEGGKQNFDQVYFADEAALFFGSPDLAELHRTLDGLEQTPLREAADFLEGAVRRREEAGDLWPDGRLQWGIALAELGEFERAAQVFEEVIQICERGEMYRQANLYKMAA